MRFSVNCSGLTNVTDTEDPAGLTAADANGAMLPSHSASAARMAMVPRLDPAMRFMFHLACDLLHGKFDMAGVALSFSFRRARSSSQGRSRIGGQERRQVRLSQKRPPHKPAV